MGVVWGERWRPLSGDVSGRGRWDGQLDLAQGGGGGLDTVFLPCTSSQKALELFVTLVSRALEPVCVPPRVGLPCPQG